MYALRAQVKQKNIPDKTAWALPGKCTKSAYGHGLARAGVGALAACAGGVGGVSLHCDLIQLKMGEPA